MKTTGGLEYAIQKMKAYQKEALAILAPFPENDYKEALILMVNYVIERKI